MKKIKKKKIEYETLLFIYPLDLFIVFTSKL